MKNQTVIVLDFGGQYKELIARRVRECGVYSVILPGNCSLDRIRALDPIGIITTGGPMSVYKSDSPRCDRALFELGVPILGICYGFQLMSYTLGGTVEGCTVSEYGQTEMVCDPTGEFFRGFDERQTVLMSHTDRVTAVPEGFVATAHTADCPIAAMENKEKKLFGIQFHPEVIHTENGVAMIRQFLYSACGAKGDYSMDDYIDRQIEAIREQVGRDKVLLALSGGVDSSVCAALLSKAIPNQLVCVFVDHGFMRKNEGDEIEAIFAKRDLQFIRVNAEDRYLKKLAGISDPETKRKIIGSEFVAIFEEEAKKLEDVKYLAQGTIYPDVIESGTDKASTIKSHHNVGGLPETMDFKGVIEPLRGLFKDEVRRVGRQLGLPKFLVERQPFPGPGLAIRVMGDLTKEKLDLLRDADAIFREEVDKLRKRPNQYFAVLTNARSVGVMGDERTYDYVLALRAVITDDFMTCEYAPLSQKFLARVSRRITNEVKGVNRVTYDITAKPPATVEWE